MNIDEEVCCRFCSVNWGEGNSNSATCVKSYIMLEHFHFVCRKRLPSELPLLMIVITPQLCWEWGTTLSFSFRFRDNTKFERICFL